MGELDINPGHLVLIVFAYMKTEIPLAGLAAPGGQTRSVRHRPRRLGAEHRLPGARARQPGTRWTRALPVYRRGEPGADGDGQRASRGRRPPRPTGVNQVEYRGRRPAGRRRPGRRRGAPSRARRAGAAPTAIRPQAPTSGRGQGRSPGRTGSRTAPTSSTTVSDTTAAAHRAGAVVKRGSTASCERRLEVAERSRTGSSWSTCSSRSAATRSPRALHRVRALGGRARRPDDGGQHRGGSLPVPRGRPASVRHRRHADSWIP